MSAMCVVVVFDHVVVGGVVDNEVGAVENHFLYGRGFA